MVVAADGLDKPVTVPRPLSSKREEASRRHVVEQFVKWTLKHPEIKNKLSAHDLAPEKPKGNPEDGIGVSRKTLGKWFPDGQCGGSTWHALCYMGVEVLELYDPPSHAPRFVRACASTYREWWESWQARDAEPGTDWHSLSGERLVEFVKTHSDLTEMTEVVRHHTERLHEELSTSSAFGSVRVSRDNALAAADAITSIADLAIRRVYRQRERLSPAAKEHCVPIVEAAVDAHRLRSRIPEKESDELGLLLDLRNLGLDITRDKLSRADIALNEYHSDMVRALLSTNVDEAVNGEIAAIEELLEAITDLGVSARGTGSRKSRRRPDRHSIDADRLVVVVVNIASNLVVHPENDALHLRARACAERVLKVYKRADAKPDRMDAEELLAAALVRTVGAIAPPLAALRIVKFRGVGEVLLARQLVYAATADFDGAAAADDIRVYLGDDPETHRQRRILALQRAIGLYGRASGWLRNRGVSGALRQIAEDEREMAEAALASLRPVPLVTDIDHTDAALAAIKKMRANLDMMIVDGLLEANLNSWADLQDLGAKVVVADLAGALNEAMRYIKRPELGLRTDLPLLGTTAAV